MGGSGGGFFYQSDSSSLENIGKKIRTQEEQTESQSFESSISAKLGEILQTANNRDTELIQDILSNVENSLSEEIEGSLDLRYGGSVAKHTYVDGFSDVDSLVILNNSDLANLAPNEVKRYFYEKLRDQFPNADIELGKLAVSIKFPDGTEIQLLPAIKKDNAIKIASSRRENEWSNVIHPDKFAKVLKYVNQQNNGKLIPVIKLAKSLIAGFPESRRITGYHAECLAIEAFKKYDGPLKPKEMLKHFFAEGAKHVLNPIKDKTGQSVHVDTYLGENNSLNRKMVSDSMASLARRMQNADGAKNIRLWDQILD